MVVSTSSPHHGPVTAITYPGATDLLRNAALEAADRRADPLADAVARSAADDPAVWADLRRGLQQGQHQTRTPSVRALLQEMEDLTAAADPEVLAEGELVSHTSPQAVHVLDVGAGALISTYRAPRTAHILVGTGRLTADAPQRLTDTARWLSAASLPGGLLVGALGYVLTGQVRVGHAAARLRAVRRLEAGNPIPDLPAGAVPISQLDMARTWLDFTYVAPRAAHALGFSVTDAEYVGFLTYWRHLGELLGVERSLTDPVVDRHSAGHLHALIDARTAAPTRDCCTLTSAGLDVLTVELSRLTPVPARIARPLVTLASRTMLGDDLADALGIGASGPLTALLKPVAWVASTHREVRRRHPQQWRAAIGRNVRASREFLAQSAPVGSNG